MPVDPEYLRKLYASLSDEALLAMNRTDLVEAARKCYDEELGRRDLAQRRGGRRTDRREETPEAPDAVDQPDWMEDAAQVYSRADWPGSEPAPDIANARDALEAAGIPCYVDRFEIPEKSVSREPTHEWRIMVPGNLNLHATSVLERDVFNADFESEWKTHLETLSDEELREMDPQVTFCGLFDRIERVTRAYDDELARRKSRSE